MIVLYLVDIIKYRNFNERRKNNLDFYGSSALRNKRINKKEKRKHEEQLKIINYMAYMQL